MTKKFANGRYAQEVINIAEGLEGFSAFSEREDVIAAGADIWGGVAGAIPVPADAGEQLEIISTGENAGNDVADGTGVRTVEVRYLDANGIEESQIVTLTGNTPVALTNPNIRFINDFHARTVGSGIGAAGLITIYKQGAPSTVYSRIRLGGHVNLSSQKMVPFGKTFYLTQWTATAVGGKRTIIRLRITSRHGVLYPRVFTTIDSAYLLDSVCARDFTIPIKIPALSIIKAFADPVIAGSYVSASWHGWIE